MTYCSPIFRAFSVKVSMLAAIVLTCIAGRSSGAHGALLTQPGMSIRQPSLSGRVFTGETIVYVSADGRELRLIQPDGGNDRLLWRVPNTVIGSAISDVVWRPDARQIAFTSTHEGTCSEFGSDIYLINPDGGHLRRLTNAPACAALSSYPQGSASVDVENRLSNLSEYLVYIEGAPTAIVVTILPNATARVTFPQVADLGAGVLQSAVVINGSTRWFDAGIRADISPGKNTHLGRQTITNGGFSAYGASHPSWSPDGNKLAYQFGQGSLWQVSMNVPILEEGRPLLEAQTNNSVAGTDPDWSPIGNEVLYQRYDQRPSTIARAEVDGTNPGTDLASVVLISGLDWLNDGSGFIVADDDSLLTHTDLYRMTFADSKITQLTTTTGHQAAAEPSSSPDDSQIVYIYVEDAQANPLNPQLRIMNSDGTGDHPLIPGGRVPDWSRVAPQNPTYTPVYLPHVRR